MKVLIVCNTSWGIYNFRAGLIRHLQKSGHEIAVLAPHDGFSQRLIDMGVLYRPIDLDNKGVSPARDLRFCYNIRGVLNRIQPDAVIGYTVKCCIYGALAARSLGIPFLPVVTGLGSAFISETVLTKLVVQLYRRALRRCSSVVFLNTVDLEAFLERRIVTVDQAIQIRGEGIDLARYRAGPSVPIGPFVVLMVARALEEKGLSDFVEAARLSRAKGAKMRFQFLGAPDPNNPSSVSLAQLKAWDDEGVIEYLGVTDDVRPHIAAASCIVLPSYREGLPRTLLEAMALSRPVVATDVPGCEELVVDDENGYLCQVRDPGSLLAAIERVAQLPESRQREMGQRGRWMVSESYADPLSFVAFDAWLENLSCSSEQL